jgi:hypothetical protein
MATNEPKKGINTVAKATRLWMALRYSLDTVMRCTSGEMLRESPAIVLDGCITDLLGLFDFKSLNRALKVKSLFSGQIFQKAK